PRSSEDAFETIKEALVQLLEADACSLFARQRDGRQLYCVATTGLDSTGPAVYDIDHDGGYTTYLARHPGQCIRKSDVQRPDEKAGGPGGPPGGPQAGPLGPRPGTRPVKSTQPGVVAAVARFVRPVPNLNSPRTLIDELLHDLVVIFRDHPIYQASVLVRHKH